MEVVELSSTEQTTAVPGPDQSFSIGVTKTERQVLLLHLILTTLASVFLNGSVLWRILRERELRQKPLFTLLGCQILCDLARPFLYVPQAVSLLVTERDHGVIAAAIEAGLGQGIAVYLPLHIITLVTVERYIYLCRPFLYQHYFSKGRILVYLAVIVLVLVSIHVASVATNGAESGAVMLFYIAKEEDVISEIVVFSYLVLPALIHGFCFVSIARAAIRQSQTVIHLAMPGISHREPSPVATHKRIFKAVSGAARLCGVFCVTWVPSSVVTGVLAGVEHDQAILQYLERYSAVVLMTLVPIVNPLLCLRNTQELREKWIRGLGRRPRQVQPDWLPVQHM